MSTLTVSVSEDIKKKIEAYPEINWSEVARQAFKEKIADLELLEDIKSKSTITDKDALEWGKELNKRMSKRYLEKRGS